jgi:hypothetical protein
MNAKRVAMGVGLLATVLLGSAFSARAAGTLSRWSLTPVWSVPLRGVQMVADAPRRAGGPAHIIAQGQERLVALDAAGKVLADKPLPGGPLNAAMGDVDGDGADEVIVAQGAGATSLAVFDGVLKTLWPASTVAGLTQASRVLAVDLTGDRRREVVVGDAQGRVVAVGAAGRVLWSYAFPAAATNAEIRALDDIALGSGRGRVVVAARRSGQMVLLDAAGKVVANPLVRNPVRRLRVFDVDGDGRDEAVVGDESGAYQLVAADGKQSPLGSIGDTVTEIRTLEADGDAASREIVVGGKRGGFVLLSGRTVRARGTVPGKISAAGGADADGDGRDELFVGTEEGGLFMFDERVQKLAEVGSLGKVERIFGVENNTRGRLIVVAAGAAISGLRAERLVAPAWYAPWAPAVLGFLAIGVGTLALLVSHAPAPPPTPAVDQKTQEIDRSIARVKDLMARGVATAEQGAERLKQLEKQRAKGHGEAAPSRSRRATATGAPPPPPPRRKA